MKPSFIIHTGDITHLSKPEDSTMPTRSHETGLKIIGCPASTTLSMKSAASLSGALRQGLKGRGLVQLRPITALLHWPVNVVDLKGGGLGTLGAEHSAWLEADLKGKSDGTPNRLFAHIPLQVVYKEWGWGTEDGTRALELLKSFGSVTVLNGHIISWSRSRSNMTSTRDVDGISAAGSRQPRLRRDRWLSPPTNSAPSLGCPPST